MCVLLTINKTGLQFQERHSVRATGTLWLDTSLRALLWSSNTLKTEHQAISILLQVLLADFARRKPWNNGGLLHCYIEHELSRLKILSTENGLLPPFLCRVALCSVVQTMGSRSDPATRLIRILGTEWKLCIRVWDETESQQDVMGLLSSLDEQ